MKQLSLDIFIKAFLSFKWYEWILFISMIVIGGISAFVDNTHPLWYIIVAYAGSVMGVLCIFMCAHASWYNWIFGAINTCLSIVILAYNKVYGTMSLELLYYLPVNIIGLFVWLKHLDTEEVDKCKTRIMSWKLKLLMFTFVAICTICLHFILKKLGGSVAWLDAFVVSLGLLAMYYEVKRYAEQYYLWLTSNIIGVIQWIILADTIMLTKKSIYVIMSVIGLINWIRMQKAKNIDNN